MAIGHNHLDIRLDPVDHMHGDDAVAMDPVEATEGQAPDGTGWFRFELKCRRADCPERFVVVVRTKTTIEGETESWALR
jgi:hypothetical protein